MLFWNDTVLHLHLGTCVLGMMEDRAPWALKFCPKSSKRIIYAFKMNNNNLHPFLPPSNQICYCFSRPNGYAISGVQKTVGGINYCLTMISPFRLFVWSLNVKNGFLCTIPFMILFPIFCCQISGCRRQQ